SRTPTRCSTTRPPSSSDWALITSRGGRGRSSRGPMPFISRPDGVRLAYEEQGAGPLVVLANQFFGDADTFSALVRDLASDHRFVSYHLRGTGDSDRQGPYDFETDAADLQAVIEAAGEPAVVLAFADGCNRAVRVAARRPDLATVVVSPGGNPVGLEAVEGT